MKLPSDEVVSGWMPVTQERINAFADATNDRQWIHVDSDNPIAHGFLTLSMLPHLLRDAVQLEGVAMSVNYGLNRVRFTAPVPSGSRIRGRFRVAAADENKVTWNVTVECDAAAKPCCVAEWVTVYYER
ncbi:MAG TPA: MaoC family dehydratase [Thermoanaerobaculia bacterium]|nr:MaoC family dehydratase [Thermoanaerobaculia bacterium]